MALDVGEWLEGLRLGQYARAFADHDIEQDLLPELSEDDLEKLGVRSLGHRKRLLKEIEALKSELESTDWGAAGRPIAPQAGSEPERRQLAVLFCDLVGSTELSHHLDPEDLREVLRRYQDAVAGAVTRYGGYVARYVGDGVLVYFGWPQAHEDQAERAVRSGLNAVAAVASIRLDDDTRLRARVGIATGQVVIGDLVGDSGRDAEAVTGETPNLAARLQGLAEPSQVVIDAGTWSLVGTAFELNSLGDQDLKGFSRLVPVWHVVGKGKVESRFEAAHAGGLRRVIGREHELGLAKERWTQAGAGEGQIVLLAGEAGIGKSRLVQALCDTIGDEDRLRLRYQCSPYHTNSAFYPVIQRLERTAGFTVEDDVDARLDKLEALLRLSGDDLDPGAPLFAALLSLAAEHRYGALALSPKQQRDRTIEALIRHLLHLSQQRPILFLLEDAHWIDPTTEALIGEAMKRVADAPVLMLLTYRPEYTPPWSDLPTLTKIALGRLSKEQAEEMVRTIAGNELPGSVIAQIVARADGVPLFLEELTKSLLETDAENVEIPASLQALLVARLDRLGEAGKLAPLAATFGRSFDYRSIRAITTLDGVDLDRGLATMKEAGLLMQSGIPPQATYTFKHALIRDAAYGTLLKSKRRQYHARVAEVLLQGLVDRGPTEPELIARHLSLAGLPDRAVEHWLLAGKRAGERSAHVEAIANLETGLRELDLLPKSQSRDEYEFALRIALGASLLTVKGWSAPQVEENYQRAQELSACTGDVHKLFTALRGLLNVFLLRGELEKARQIADRLLTIAVQQDDKGQLLEGYRAVGMCCFFAGKFTAARAHLQRANALYDRTLHHSHAFIYGTDPGVVGLSVEGWVQWFAGDPDEGRRSIDAALHLAEDVQHPFSRAYARSLAASLYQACRDPVAVCDHADVAIAIAQEHGYPYWIGWATVMRGWALSAQEHPQQAVETLRRGLELHDSTGARLIKPYILTLIAEAYGRAELPLKGLEALDEIYGSGSPTEVRFYQAETYRVRGELIRQAQTGDGRDDFERALTLAREQESPALELRAAVSAGRVLLERGERKAARALVGNAYQTFDSSLTDPDILDAHALLEAAGKA